MLQNPCKTLSFKKNMVYKIPPGGEVNHIQPVAYKQYWFGSPVKISKQGLSAGLIINSVLLVGR